MTQNKYNQFHTGSQWRRWDIHIHTPETNKNDQFEGVSTDNKWDKFCDTINSYSNEISVVGITDYFSIENYFKFKQKIVEGKISKSFDLILPNVELRISPVTGTATPINIHCIFNPEIEDELQDRFFAKLKFSYSGSDFSATKSEIIRLGKKYSADPDISDDSAYDKGINQYVIEFSKLKSIFSEDTELRKNTIVIVSNSSGDGASGLSHANLFESSTSQLDATRRSIYQFSDAIFSSNPKDRNYFLGLGVDKESLIIMKCGGIKPCFHGSDAHSNDKVFQPTNDRFCWIKSDPTFEGLKQVLYEPAERVFIGEEKPDEKLLYHLIDKVKFQDDNFSTNEIEINQNLTTIIGGKSTGKSILLKNIAKSIDKEEYNKRMKTAGLSYTKPIKGMEEYWKDGQVSSLGSENNPSKRIIYIPQSYLNRVVDLDKESTDIDDIIKEVLLQDDDFNEWSKTLSLKEKKVTDNIENGIRQLFDKIDEYKEKRKELKKVGDEKGIAKQIKKITEEINVTQSKVDIKKKDIEEYNSKIEAIKKDKLQIEFLSEDIMNLERLKAVSIFLYDQKEYSFKVESISKALEDLNTLKTEEYNKNWSQELSKLISKYSKEKEDLLAKNKKEVESIEPLQEKIDSQKVLTTKYKQLEEEQKKDQVLLTLKKEIKDELTNIDSLTKDLSSQVSDFYSLYLEAKDNVKNTNLDDELSFDIRTEFRDNYFFDSFIKKFFDGRSINKAEYTFLSEYTFKTKESYKDFIYRVIWSLFKKELPLRNENSTREVFTGLLKNWFIHNYIVEYEGDLINELSPGKKSFVLLRLLIDLDNSKCPILIDQPEDDLDNRSIYNQVVSFLRKRKGERQIIIATHNPNIVLGADAEQIIVANQEGKKSKNKSSKFEYVSGSIEHSIPEDDKTKEVLYKRGIQEHICDILEGGEIAFNKRKNKYNF